MSKVSKNRPKSSQVMRNTPLYTAVTVIQFYIINRKMMKLSRCRFEGLPGFDVLELSDLQDLTTLTGPNGAGKSTVLHVLKLALDIVASRRISNEITSLSPWHRFSRATLCFKDDKPVALYDFDGYFNGIEEDVIVEISLNSQHFDILSVSRGSACIQITPTGHTTIALATLQSEADALSAGVQETESQIAALTRPGGTPKSHNQLQNETQHRANLSSSLKAKRETHSSKLLEIEEKSRVVVQFTKTEKTSVFDRETVEGFLSALAFPDVHHVDALQLYQDAIPKLIEQLSNQKKGRLADNKKYLETIGKLQHLIQSEVDVSDVGGSKDMHVNGVQYKHASSGTQISLSFFGLTRLGQPNCIILWDEPENGLHPTRRARLLELMFGDGRQFILATHAAEFAPIFSPKGKVFRCEANYDADSTEVRLSTRHVADRRDAFSVLEALGVHPARALFTANVVIWVEGPTELVFYKHWLVPRLKSRDLHEGFHYTFMQYGGALISYLSVADEQQFDSTFDLLSVCRHPIVIVDSDLRQAANPADPAQFLKRGAARLFAEIQKVNNVRRDAALFEWTSGREIENYLPESAIWHAVEAVWQGYQTHKEALQGHSMQIGQYDSYEDALHKHFDAAEVVDLSKDDPPKRAAKGRSLWGGGNKVDMMRNALEMPGLSEANLKWRCSDALQRIENFIVRISER